MHVQPEQVAHPVRVQRRAHARLEDRLDNGVLVALDTTSDEQAELEQTAD